MVMETSHTSIAQPTATAYPYHVTHLNQSALDASSANRRVSTETGEDPFRKIVEKRERDTKKFLIFIVVMGLVCLCEAVYVFCFRKV
jgi:hypothetical protein